MANVEMLYEFLNSAIPAELSCEWDNDGRMCIPCPEKEVKKALICLDASESAIDYAIKNGFDCIITHHPFIFSPISNIDGGVSIGRKACKLIKNDVAVLSFHTRLDKVSGGVNDALADVLDIKNIEDFSDIGRMGTVEKVDLTTFAAKLKEILGADRVVCVDSGRMVSKIAIVGGSGKGYLCEALECGCDTFLTGEMPYNCEHEAKELGINLICGGHYFTENIVCARLEMLVKNFDSGIHTEFFESNVSFCV